MYCCKNAVFLLAVPHTVKSADLDTSTTRYNQLGFVSLQDPSHIWSVHSQTKSSLHSGKVVPATAEAPRQLIASPSSSSLMVKCSTKQH